MCWPGAWRRWAPLRLDCRRARLYGAPVGVSRSRGGRTTASTLPTTGVTGTARPSGVCTVVTWILGAEVTVAVGLMRSTTEFGGALVAVGRLDVGVLRGAGVLSADGRAIVVGCATGSCEATGATARSSSPPSRPCASTTTVLVGFTVPPVGLGSVRVPLITASNVAFIVGIGRGGSAAGRALPQAASVRIARIGARGSNTARRWPVTVEACPASSASGGAPVSGAPSRCSDSPDWTSGLGWPGR
jgi:hypothetical protein